MANKFTKLNIGDSVASGGGRVFKKLSTVTIPTEQLPAPYGVSLDGDYLTWGDYSVLATSFDILVDGVVKATVSAPTNSFDLSTLGLADGTYSITVVSKASGYANSDPSEVVEYVVGGDELAGTWVFNDSINMTGGFQFDVDFSYFSSNDNRYYECSALGNYMFYDDFVDYPDDYDTNKLFYFEDDLSTLTSVNVYNGRWLNDTNKNINITSKLSEVTNGAALLAWLKANAVKQ